MEKPVIAIKLSSPLHANPIPPSANVLRNTSLLVEVGHSDWPPMLLGALPRFRELVTLAKKSGDFFLED